MKLHTIKVMMSCALLGAVISQSAAQTAKNGKDTVGAVSANTPSIATVQKTEHFWFDGAQRRPLQIVPDQVAQFSPDGKVKLVPSAVINLASQEKSANSSTLTAESPLFTDSGKRRALPGGMIVKLQNATSAADARAQLVSAGLTPIRMLNIQSELGVEAHKVWLVASNPGIESLNWANELHTSGKFVSVQPNWWVQRTLK